MPRVFLSHKSEDKRIVLKIQQYLYQNFIESWVDKQDLPGGAPLWETINSGIHQVKYFMLVLSKNFSKSDWGKEEFSVAYTRKIKGQLKIIPVFLVDENKPDLSAFSQEIQTLLENVKYVEFDLYNQEAGCQAIVDAIWAHESVKFYPLEMIEIQAQKLQLIRFQTATKDLPTSFLQTWDFQIDKFIADHDNDGKLIKPGFPVAFSGAAPNWLITYLTIPFKNLRDVFLFNKASEDYICVHSRKNDMIGKVLKAL
jgi:hypothetical protein